MHVVTGKAPPPLPLSSTNAVPVAAVADADADAGADADAATRPRRPPAGEEAGEEWFEIAGLEVWAVDAPRARVLPGCAGHGVLPIEH